MRKSWGYTSDCKLCISKKSEIYRKNNIDKIKESHHKYYINNIEKSKIWGAKRNGKPTTEKRKLYLAEYKKTHKVPKELMALRSSDRRARERNAQGNLTVGKWREILFLYENKCLCCGKCGDTVKITVDHVIPLIAGGKHSTDNVQPLCFSCNSRKGRKTIDYRGDLLYGG